MRGGAQVPFLPEQEERRKKMSRSKAMFVTAMIMALMSAVIFFIWMNGKGFGIVEALLP